MSSSDYNMKETAALCEQAAGHSGLLRLCRPYQRAAGTCFVVLSMRKLVAQVQIPAPPPPWLGLPQSPLLDSLGPVSQAQPGDSGGAPCHFHHPWLSSRG